MKFFKKFLNKSKSNGLVWIYRGLLNRLNRYFTINRSYNSIGNLRSWSDNGTYVRVVKEFLINEKKFNKFKRNQIYQDILEHVSYSQGEDYLKIINEDNKDLINNINEYKFNDLSGSPIKHKYPKIGEISPTTLRYLKVASDIKKYFKYVGDNFIEIGGGYGGQYLILDKIFNITSYTILDLNDVNKLIEKYVEQFVTNSFYKATTLNQLDNTKSFDFIISNYGFSELPRKLQIAYLNKVIKKSKRGYMTMNSGLVKSLSNNNLLLDELKLHLPNLKVIKEEPLTAKDNYIIIWDKDNFKTR